MSKEDPDFKKDEIDIVVAAKVKARREQLGLSQPALAKLLNKNQSFIGHIESPRNRAKYNVGHLNALAKILKCSPQDFLPEKPI